MSSWGSCSKISKLKQVQPVRRQVEHFLTQKLKTYDFLRGTRTCGKTAECKENRKEKMFFFFQFFAKKGRPPAVEKEK